MTDSLLPLCRISRNVLMFCFTSSIFNSDFSILLCHFTFSYFPSTNLRTSLNSGFLYIIRDIVYIDSVDCGAFPSFSLSFIYQRIQDFYFKILLLQACTKFSRITRIFHASRAIGFCGEIQKLYTKIMNINYE